jgi:hypothetical protein
LENFFKEHTIHPNFVFKHKIMRGKLKYVTYQKRPNKLSNNHFHFHNRRIPLFDYHCSHVCILKMSLNLVLLMYFRIHKNHFLKSFYFIHQFHSNFIYSQNLVMKNKITTVVKKILLDFFDDSVELATIFKNRSLKINKPEKRFQTQYLLLIIWTILVISLFYININSKSFVLILWI